MLIYLEIDTEEIGKKLEIVKNKKQGVYSISYHKTVLRLHGCSQHIDGIVIPGYLGDQYDYDVLLMILHIRLFFDEAFSQLPIFVYVNDENRYYNFFDKPPIKEQVYNSIGVLIVVDLPAQDNVEFIDIDKEVLAQFLKEKAGFPWFTQGRHDQANRWGPYTFLLVLNKVLGNNKNDLQEVENEMFEEPYLKWLSRKITVQEDTNSIKTRLVHIQSNLKQQLENISRKSILIVEDRLQDGWRHVYDAVFCSELLGIEIIWAKNESEALENFSEDLAFVILDMRLSDDTGSEEKPAGISLAKKFRQQHPFVPVIVATASNKSWVLQSLTDQGIDAYWVKASPESGTDFDHLVENALDFHKKVISTLKWSLKTRDWNEALYHVAEVVAQVDHINGNLLEKKVHSFHALMQRSFTPFSKEISAGLQQNLAFLIAYSCMNDLVSWVLDIEQVDDDASILAVWYTEIDGDRKKLVSKRKNEKGEVYYEILNDGRMPHDFPDKTVALTVLGRYNLDKQSKKLREMSTLRNGLPLIHGKSAELRINIEREESVNDVDVSCIIGILFDLMEAHSHQLH